MELIVENTPIPKKGRKPTTKEYQLGTEIFDVLKEVGNSVFIPSVGIDERFLSIRLKRIDIEREFSIRKEIGKIGKAEAGFRIYRIK